MVKYYNAEGSIYKLKDDQLISPRREWISINNIYIVDEDGVIEGKEVHTGDVIITFYSDDPMKFAIISKDSDFTKIFVEAVELRKRKEVSKNECCECCDSCSA